MLQKIGTDPNYSGYIYETPSEFFIGLPDTTNGLCSTIGIPPRPAPVYRLWNNRADSNHRYVTDLGLRSTMIGRGYVPEGYGPLGAVMCAVPRTDADSRVRVTGSSPLAPGCEGAASNGVLSR